MNTRHPPAVPRTFGLLCIFRAVSFTVLCLAPLLQLRADPDENLDLAITRAELSSGPASVLTWTSVAGASYKVQYSPTLIPPAPWQDFEVVTATSAMSSSEVPLALLGPGTPSPGFYRLVLPQLTISGLEPALLNIAGGQLFITGQLFAAGDTVRINGVDLPTNAIDHTLLSATLPGFAAGIYDVQIARDGRVIATLTDALTVTNGPPIETLEPPSLPLGAPVPSALPEVDDEVLVVFIHGDVSPPAKMEMSSWLEAAQAGTAGGSGEVVALSVDLTVPGRGLDFIWATTYRSRNGEAATMGNNWTHSYDIRVAQSGADLLVRDGTGRRDTYFLQADGSYSKRGFFRRGTLAAGVFTLEFADKGRWIFNPLGSTPSAGKIAQSVDRNGNALQFSYDGAGRLATIVDTLGRTYQVQYDGSGRVGALVDFSGRSVVYSYYGTGNPLGANGMLRAIRSPLVTGTPTGNNFPAGKTVTFTYTIHPVSPALSDNLLTVTDPKGQTYARFTYSPSLVATDVNFDCVLSAQLGNNADPIDKSSCFVRVSQLPSPANGYAVLKLIANDPVGNVRETFFDSRNLPVVQREYTGRAIPGVEVTETANRPAGQLRASDPQFFETRAQWNLNYLPTRVTLPRGNALAFVWETDFNPTATARVAGNLRALRQVGLAGETLVWRMKHEPGFGSVEQPRSHSGWTGWSPFYRSFFLDGDPDQPIIVGAVYNAPQTVDSDPNVVYVGGSRRFAGKSLYFPESMLTEIPGGGAGSTSAYFNPKEITIDKSVPWQRMGGNPGGGAASGLGLVAPIPRLNGNRLYVGGLSWDRSVDSSSGPLRLCDGGGPCTWPSARKSHPDFLWWPTAKPSPAESPTPPSGVDAGDYILWRKTLGSADVDAGDYILWRKTMGAADVDGRDYVVWRKGNSPSTVTNPRGLTTTATYDNAGNCTQIQSPLSGTADTFTYNGFGQVTSRVLPANGSGSKRTDTFTYHTAGSQQGYLADVITDAGGLALGTHFEYDARGNVTRVVDPRGNDTLLARNQLNQVVRASSPTVNGARNERDFIYDANDNVVRVDVQNRDANGALGTPTHFSTTWNYDFRNCGTNRTETIGANQTTTVHFAYDGNRNLTQLTLPEAVNGTDPFNIARFQYDERGLLFRAIGAAGAAVQSTTQFDYDRNGSLLQRSQGIESAPRITRYSYDGFDRLIGMIDAGGNTATLTRDGMGNVTSLEIMGNAEPLPAPSRLLLREDYSYNEVNQLNSSRLGFFHPVTGLPFGDGARATTLVRAPNQQVKSMTDDNAHTTSFVYDSANRLARTTDARGNAVDYTRDANGNVTIALMTDKRDSGAPDEQFRVTAVYDPLNRAISAQDNVGNLTTYHYDSRGNLTRLIDPRATATFYGYDGLGRRVRSVEDMDGSGTETSADLTRVYQYDDDSRLTRLTDDNGNVTSYTYNSLNRLTARQLEDNTEASWTYDVHGNRISSVDANGTKITSTYDLLNRLTRRDISPGAGVATTTTFETFSYDGMGRVLRAVNDGSTVDFTYDSLSNLRSETLGASITSYTYDAVGNRRSLTYPGGRVLTYSQDAINRCTAVLEGTLTLGSFLYAGRDRLERANFANGTRLEMIYDGQVGGPAVPGDFGWRRPVLVSHTRIAGGAVLDRRAMTWDRNQNKVTRHRLTPFVAGGPTQTRLFDYDADDRLIHSNVALSSGPMLDTQYQLDGEGNRERVIGGINPGVYTLSRVTPVPADFQVNQYTTTPFDARQYDENGNLRSTTPTGPNGVSRTTGFDYANRLVSAVLAGGLQAQYRYDALGRRIQRDVQAPGPPIVATTRFLYDGASVIEERDSGGGLLASYASAPPAAGDSSAVATLLTSEFDGELIGGGGALDLPLQMRRGGQDFWLSADDAGNVLALTDAAGAVIERYEYDDYGEVQFLNPAGAPIVGATQSGAGNPYLFRGLRYEPEPRFFLGDGLYWDPQAARAIAPNSQNALRLDAPTSASSTNLPTSYSLKLPKPMNEQNAFGLR